MIFLDDTQHLFLQYLNLTRHQMQSSNAIDVQNGIETAFRQHAPENVKNGSKWLAAKYKRQKLVQ